MDLPYYTWLQDITILMSSNNLQSINILLTMIMMILLLSLWIYINCFDKLLVGKIISMIPMVSAESITSSNSKDWGNDGRIPFIYMLPSSSSLSIDDTVDSILTRALARYKENTMDSNLRNLIRSLELIRRIEWSSIKLTTTTLSKDYEHRIQQTASIIDKDYTTLCQIYSMRYTSSSNESYGNGTNKFSYWTLALPEPPPPHDDDDVSIKDNNYSIPINTGNNATNLFGSFIPQNETMQEKNRRYVKDTTTTTTNEDVLTSNKASYDSIAQVIIHIVRDWSEMGHDIRKNVYDWVITNLSIHGSRSGKVLIPGSGLGRLAYDVATQLPQYTVEANELSITMVTACHYLLHHFNHKRDNNNNNNNQKKKKKKIQLHPFTFDYMVNELDTKYRFQSVTIPDVDTIHIPHDNLSFTVGDFVQIYSQESYRETVDAVVTCFFLDTATNLFEYILTIQNVLKRGNNTKNGGGGGIWIHVGPVQWHGQAQIAPSVEELHRLFQQLNFTILHWSIDEIPIPYRPTYPSTRFEGYTPLRFIIELNNDQNPSENDDNNIYESITTMRHILASNLSTTIPPQ